jgi:Holliday junction DNA helicase RuvA
MIGRLKGIVDETGEDWVIVDVGGVGYEVHCPARTLANLPGRGEAVTLTIETHVREDMIRLYGFASAADREWFRALQTVQGVGSKVSLAVLSVLSPAELASAVALGDTAQISRAPGVGAKVAQRIATELKDRAAKLGGGVFGTVDAAAIAGGAATAGPMADAVSALVNLGYGRTEASSAVARAMKDKGEDSGVAELIRQGLKELAR